MVITDASIQSLWLVHDTARADPWHTPTGSLLGPLL